jgi:hypothetical protein
VAWLPEAWVVTYAPNFPASLDSLVFLGNGRPLEIDSLMRSFDYGSSWSGVAIQFMPYDRFALLRSGVHLVQEIWTTVFETRYSYSSDAGVTWSQHRILSTDDGYSSDQPNIAGDSDGGLYTGWRDGKYGSIGGFGASIIIRRSTNGGLTWLPEQLLSIRPDGYFPRIAAKGNRVAVSWVEDVAYDAVFTFSSNSGQTWIPPITVGDIVNNSAVALTNAHVHLVWSQRTSVGVGHVFYLRGSVITTSVKDGQAAPARFVLLQNYPNPFNNSTTIGYRVPKPSTVQIVLYDVLGREVERLVDATVQPGEYSVQLDAPHLSSGVYLYTMRAGEYVATRKLVLIR